MSGTDRAVASPVLGLDRLTLAPAMPSAMHGTTKSIILLSAASTVVAFLGGISVATVGEASGLSVLAERPLAAMQIVAGLSLCTTLLAVPACRGLSRLLVRREVRLLDGAVEILRHSPFGIRRKTVPISTYQGIAHHVRASLSGLTHEIVLVHPVSEFCVTLLSAERVTQGMLDECKALFGLPEISARTIYEGGGAAPAPDAPPALSTARA